MEDIMKKLLFLSLILIIIPNCFGVFGPGGSGAIVNSTGNTGSDESRQKEAFKRGKEKISSIKEHSCYTFCSKNTNPGMCRYGCKQPKDATINTTNESVITGKNKIDELRSSCYEYCQRQMGDVYGGKYVINCTNGCNL